ncbi:MAG: 4-(cytidine 5'-diphospho)-2-C-methyl-D-erythritol kinase [Bacteroides sp.]|nr:4-(cytidine 5'-diphospho)-2-C-methyl-D-erythritol kinase [Bacteroides sp.]MCM1094758.1 4-(cytidine 5'-diphospho)-2-C-methyl-D-erythritol kinase [Terasakiella sp.]
MILFPTAKINLGLRVLGKRHDGYHELTTVMMPVGWCDVLEIVPSRSGVTELHTHGRAVNCPPEKNLVMKAYRALADDLGLLPAVEIHLEKIIPDGAGLGGGSADAAFTLRGLNELLDLGLSDAHLRRVAARVGADCPFFVTDGAALCTGTGTTIAEEVQLDMSAYTLVIAKPEGVSVSTAEAYAGVHLSPGAADPTEALRLDISLWRQALVNDFETSVFARHPEIAAVKEHMYACGAAYASMSGSGAAVYGIFESQRLARAAFDSLDGCDKWVSGGEHTVG